MNKVIKVVAGLMIIFLIVVNTNYIYAADPFSFKPADEFLKKAEEPLKDENGKVINEPKLDTAKLQKAHSTVFNVLFACGIAISVIVGGILGITFMLASAEDKAKIKEMMIPYVIGCIVVYGAFGIWKFVLSVMERL